ncbi:beta strand repeat-containing protein [Lysobacter silvisoli]|uniref:DUF11 domain-containing protein n=1 Tax=Lysobacter silvisoli TaxID=2293254 RepID=A0A371K4I8_9GAMM|nr:GEVED domain-containing protein [Lysobacter silvisoli]RDZ28782.1 DUF11 domain-containing protein [Lysobacter silvisoli]
MGSSLVRRRPQPVLQCGAVTPVAADTAALRDRLAAAEGWVAGAASWLLAPGSAELSVRPGSRATRDSMVAQGPNRGAAVAAISASLMALSRSAQARTAIDSSRLASSSRMATSNTGVGMAKADGYALGLSQVPTQLRRLRDTEERSIRLGFFIRARTLIERLRHRVAPRAAVHLNRVKFKAAGYGELRSYGRQALEISGRGARTASWHVDSRIVRARIVAAMLSSLTCVLPVAAQVTPVPNTTCGNLNTAEFGGSFGATASFRDLQIPATAGGYSYAGGSNTAAAQYAVFGKAYSANWLPSGYHWQNLFGHTDGSDNDAYLAVNGALTVGMFYRQSVILVAGQQYRLSMFAVNAVNLAGYNSNAPGERPNLEIRVLTPGGTVIATGQTGAIPFRFSGAAWTGPADWTQATVDFTATAAGSYTVEVRNLTTSFNNNDFAIDDITVAPLLEAGCPRDFGDAPDTASGTSQNNYQTLSADGGPRHTLVGGLYLGGAATNEADALQNGTATGDADDTRATAIPNIVLTPGQIIAIPVTVTNTTGENAFLTGFLDFNRDGDFLDTGESLAATVVAANTGAIQTVNLSFTVPNTAVPGVGFARFRLARSSSEIASAAGNAANGEVEDYQVNLLPTVSLTKIWQSGISPNAVTLTIGGGTDITAGSSTAGGATTVARDSFATTGGTATLTETFTNGTTANYVSALSCVKNTDNSPLTVTAGTVTSTSVNFTVTVPSDSLAVCTYTNTRRVRFRLAKAWTSAIAGDVARLEATVGLSTNTVPFTAAAPAATNGAEVIVGAAETATLPAETMTVGTLANYTTTLACDNGATLSGTNGQASGNTVVLPSTLAADALVTCTYTNALRTSTLQLAKAWAAGSLAGNQVTIGASSGGTNNTEAFTATAPTVADSGAAVVVTIGNTITLPAEGGANAVNYTTTVGCTGGHALSGTDGQQTNTLTINSTNPAVCTYTNTLRTTDLSITKTNTPGAGPSDQTDDTVTAGASTAYTVVVSNHGAQAVIGAVVRDAPQAGLNCPAGNVVTCSGVACPGGAITVGDLAAGVVLGALAAGATATFSFNCAVQ